MEMFKREMETIEMPKALVVQMFMDVHALAQMHENLIEMYEIESQLKKQHKAYLHVRDKAEKMCKNDRADLNEILDHYEHPGKYIDQALEIYADMFGEEMEEEYLLYIWEDTKDVIINCKDYRDRIRIFEQIK